MDFSKINPENEGMAKLLAAMKQTSQAKSKDYSQDDGPEWRLQRDKEGNGQARIRFIPSPDSELFVEVRNHGFKNPETGKWYIENCPKTLDWDNGCPCCEHANELKKGRDWKNIPESEQIKIKPYFAKTNYWTNIYVEKDPACPENEGKVFKFRMGKKILEKIGRRAADDTLDGTAGINVYDPEHGASFKLVVKIVDKFPNYDSSSFTDPTPLANYEEIIKTGIELGPLRTPANYKEYAELKKKFNTTMNLSGVTKTAESMDEPLHNGSMAEMKETDNSKTDLDDAIPDQGDEEDMSYFQNLMEDN